MVNFFVTGRCHANLYLLAIVGIVAVVGIVVLILNKGIGTDTTNSDGEMRSFTTGEFGITCTYLTGEANVVGLKKMCKVYCTDDPTCFYSRIECDSLQ